MFDRRKRKVVIRIQQGKMYINANIALNIRRLLPYTLIIGLVVILLASLISEGLREHLIEFLLGILQSVVIDYLSRK